MSPNSATALAEHRGSNASLPTTTQLPRTLGAALRVYVVSDANSEGVDASGCAHSPLTKLSWNMQAYRTLEEFGAIATGKPAVFFDQNLRHPNLAWRVLRSNDLIQKSDDSRALLVAFEDAPQRGASEQPLYRQP